MFSTLIVYMKIFLHIAALLLIFVGVSYGHVIAPLLGFNDSGPFLQGFLGALVGIFVTCITLGVPIVLININDNVAKSLELLTKLEKQSRPAGFAASSRNAGTPASTNEASGAA